MKSVRACGSRGEERGEKAGGNAGFEDQSRMLPCGEESSVKEWGLHAFAGRAECGGTIVEPTAIAGRGQVRKGIIVVSFRRVGISPLVSDSIV